MDFDLASSNSLYSLALAFLKNGRFDCELFTLNQFQSLFLFDLSFYWQLFHHRTLLFTIWTDSGIEVLAVGKVILRIFTASWFMFSLILREAKQALHCFLCGGQFALLILKIGGFGCGECSCAGNIEMNMGRYHCHMAILLYSKSHMESGVPKLLTDPRVC